MLRTLKEKRDMSLNEVKLTVAIEDPTKREQKEYMGIEVQYDLHSVSPLVPHMFVDNFQQKLLIMRLIIATPL